jgi:hypothetical protein
MSELWERTTLIRSKNAGPFELTFDVIFADDAAFEAARAHRLFTADGFAEFYDIDDDGITVFVLDSIRAIKVSIPRPAPSGDPADTDVFGAQFHSPLVRFALDVAPLAQEQREETHGHV